MNKAAGESEVKERLVNFYELKNLERTVKRYNIENLCETIMHITDGKKIIPDYTKSKCNHRGYTLGGESEYMDSVEGRIETFLFCYFDFENEVGEIICSKVSELEKIEKIYVVSKKKICNLKLNLAQIDAKINQLTKEQVEIFEKALPSGFTEELQVRGKEIQIEKSNYEYLQKLLIDYEKLLIDDAAHCENLYQSEFRKEFGKKLRDARIKRDLTIEKLAESVELKRLSINNYELGLRDPSTFTLYRLCKVLGVSADYFFDTKDNCNN